MSPEEYERESTLGIRIVNERMTVSYEQTLQLQQRTKITEALAWLQGRLCRAGMTGQITSEMQQGGCRRVVVRHVGNIPIGSELQKSIDELFDKKC